jgi:hypothetical protein
LSCVKKFNVLIVSKYSHRGLFPFPYCGLLFGNF